MTDLNSAKQQADDDLTWLARNVHRWIGGDYLIRVGKIGYTFREHCEGEIVLPNWFTRDQWLTRRAELQNKPSWKGAPKWASWLGQCPSGKWEWYGDEEEPNPHKDMDCWNHQSLGEGSGKMGEVLGNWLDTLERRPQEAKSEPSSDDWYKRGELPPVGAACQYNHSALGWIDCEIIAHHQGRAVCVARGDRLNYGTIRSFKPAKSERERVASELVDVMMAVPVSDRKTASESYMSMALAIYDHLHQGSRV